jgi:hypothetical protein
VVSNNLKPEFKNPKATDLLAIIFNQTEFHVWNGYLTSKSFSLPKNF